MTRLTAWTESELLVDASAPISDDAGDTYTVEVDC
jgi:hypothetical protein